METDRPLGTHMYDAVHLRSFDPDPPRSEGANCSKWPFADEGLACQRVRPRDMPSGRRVTGHDLCTMSDEYLRAALLLMGGGTRPLLIAHDGQNPKRVEAIKGRFEAFDATYRGDGAVFADMLLLIGARAFIGHPGSSLSQNIAAVRRVVRRRGDAPGLASNFAPCPSALLGPPGHVERYREKQASVWLGKTAVRPG